MKRALRDNSATLNKMREAPLRHQPDNLIKKKMQKARPKKTEVKEKVSPKLATKSKAKTPKATPLAQRKSKSGTPMSIEVMRVKKHPSQ